MSLDIPTRPNRPDSRRANLKRRRREAPGEILATSLYSLLEARARTGLGGRSWRRLLAEVPVHRRGNCRFLLGSDIIAAIAGKEESA